MKKKSLDEKLMTVVYKSRFTHPTGVAMRELTARHQKMMLEHPIANIGFFEQIKLDEVERAAKQGMLAYTPFELDIRAAYDLNNSQPLFDSTTKTNPDIRYPITFNRCLSVRASYDMDDLGRRLPPLLEIIDRHVDDVLNETLHNLALKRAAIKDPHTYYGIWKIMSIGAPTVWIKREAYCVEVFAYWLAGGAVLIPNTTEVKK